MWKSIRQTYDLVGREQRGRWLLLVVLALVVSLLEMVGAVLVYTLLALIVDPAGDIEIPILGDLRQQFTTVSERDLLLSVVLVIAIFFLLRGVTKVAATYAQTRASHNAGARLSRRLIEGYLRWPYSAHLHRPSAQLIRNGHQAILELVQSVILPVIKVIAEIALILGMLIVLALIAPGATALAVAVIGGAAVLLLIVVQPRLRRLGAINHRESLESFAAVQQPLQGIRDIKILGREGFFTNVYAGSRQRLARARYLHATAVQLPPIVIETALIGFILLFFTITLMQNDPTQEVLSILGLFAYVGLRLQPSLKEVVQGLNSLKFAAAPLSDIHEDFRSIQAMGTPDSDPQPLPMECHLLLERVSFRYESAALSALKNVDLTIFAGEQIGIAGPTGGGKTTLVDVIAGLLQPTEGRVMVDEADLTDNTRAWQRSLGLVPQMIFLVDDTLRANIALGVPEGQVNNVALDQAVRLAQLDEFVESLPDGLQTRVGERGVRISGGQRQRIAIARALYQRPSVLIFDEGTSALDNATESMLMNAIESLRGEHTIILVAHRLSTVRSCDRVVFIEGGQITGLGTYDELVRDNERFRAMALAG